MNGESACSNTAAQSRCSLDRLADISSGSADQTLRKSSQSRMMRKYDHSSQKRCQILFEKEEIDVPTSLVVLPYKLRRGKTRNVPFASDEFITVAVQVGKNLLGINKATAKLSFWLQMQRSLSEGESFKNQLKEWLRRARTEPVETVAQEVVQRISCEEYLGICQEVFEEEDSVSNAKAYIRNPIDAAGKEIQRETEELLRIFEGNVHYFYLVDEIRGFPSMKDKDKDGTSYPLRIRANSDLLRTVFLPFMNLAAMSAMATDGLLGLAKLVGLSHMSGSPRDWKKIGLIHNRYNPDSVTAFALLQQQVCNTVSINQLNASDSMRAIRLAHHDEFQGQGMPAVTELTLLSDFLHKRDPSREFSGLRRVRHGKTVVWTCISAKPSNTEADELSEFETRLNRLQREFVSTEKIEEEIYLLSLKATELKKMCKTSSAQISQQTLSTKSTGSTRSGISDRSSSSHKSAPSNVKVSRSKSPPKEEISQNWCVPTTVKVDRLKMLSCKRT